MKNDNQVCKQKKTNLVSNKIVLSKRQFKEFYTFLIIIKPYFKNLFIKNKMFRMRSDDSTIIVETGFNYFKNMNLTIFDTKLFVKMLSTLDKNTDLSVTVDDDNIIFRDKYQSVQVPNSNPKLIENKIFDDEIMKDFLSENYNPSKPFIKESLPKSIVCNVNKIARNFSANSVSIKHEQNDLNKGYLYIASSKNDKRHYSINLRESFLTPMKKDHHLMISNLPFIFNKEEMNITYCINEEEILLTIYTTRIDNLFVNIYGRTFFRT